MRDRWYIDIAINQPECVVRDGCGGFVAKCRDWRVADAIVSAHVLVAKLNKRQDLPKDVDKDVEAVARIV